MGFISAKGYAAGDDLVLGGKNNARTQRVGGRIDYVQDVTDVGTFTFSLTDATLKDVDNAPYLQNAIISAERKINDTVTLGAGYDLGLRSKGAFASVELNRVFSDRDVTGRAIYFQDGNVVRADVNLKIDSRSNLSAAYTFNTDANMSNTTYLNIREREGFIIKPFTVDVSTAAVKYSYETDSGYKLEPALDLSKGEGYLAVSKPYKGNVIKGIYAIKDEHAMIEVARAGTNSWPSARVYAKAPAGPSGFGPLSLGFIVDKTFDF